MCNVSGKLLSGIKNIYGDSLAYDGVKGGKSERFRIYTGLRQGYIMSPWLFNVYINAVMKKVRMVMGRMGVKFLEEGREWRLPGLVYADYFFLCVIREDLRAMVGRFVEVCRRR